MIFHKIFSHPKNIAILIDPDKISDSTFTLLSECQDNLPVSSVFVGGSLVFSEIEKVTEKIKQKTDLPVILFPGNLSQ